MILSKWKSALEIVSGKNQKTVISVDGNYPIYGSGGVIGHATDFLCPAGTTIVGRKGTINKPIFVNEPFWNVDTAFGLVPHETLNSKYLYYFCCGYNFSELDNSTTIPSLSKSVLLEIEIPLPTLPEQERIVARIEELFSELDKGVEALQTVKAQLRVFRQAVLKEAFEGKLTSKWRETNPRVISYNFQSAISQNDGMPALPESWLYVCLSQLGDLARGKSKHRPRNDEMLFKNGSYPFVQTGDIKAANKFLTTYTTMYNEVGLQQSKLWPIGTLCITIAANIAETAFLGIEACFPDSVVGFTANREFVIKEYVEYFIQSAKVRLWAFAPATAQKNINLGTLESLYVPYCNINEQVQIVAEIESRLSVCDQIEKTVDESLAKAESLRQSILKKAFEGRLV